MPCAGAILYYVVLAWRHDHRIMPPGREAAVPAALAWRAMPNQ